MMRQFYKLVLLKRWNRCTCYNGDANGGNRVFSSNNTFESNVRLVTTTLFQDSLKLAREH